MRSRVGVGHLAATGAVLAPLLVMPLPGGGASAAPALSADWALCDRAIQVVERAARTPPKLLHAIGLVESGRFDETSRLVSPWPWTINAGGQGQFFSTRQEAIDAAQTLQARGIRSIDVGCMQVNLLQHPDAFPSLDLAFDPQINVTYAARFLGQLHGRLGDWPQAAAAYHSQTPAIGAAYQRRVMAIWPLAPAFVSRQAIAPESAAAIGSAIYTPEFARRLAQDAADRAARDAGLTPRARGDSLPTRSPGIYTPEFAARRARDEAERARRLASVHGTTPSPDAGTVASWAGADPRARRHAVRDHHAAARWQPSGDHRGRLVPQDGRGSDAS